ncbi:arylsulfotransferase family protein [Pseudofrankia sp. DC12]|uniref:arylsulfotransferase family protein n=1 Tax=Pseudofrankia sp. DC12 TaxID=683315 RepID=UPI0005F8642D|nr:arylsulfotransferase family protein [Pseudofrankia sp. DC12]
MTDEVLLLYSPSASYPEPVACLTDRDGRLVHAWSNATGQPDPVDDPPSYLRGWNHVELGPDGSLYAIVPLHAVLKLRPDSSLAWSAPVPAHHDLDVAADGRVHVLTEQPRLIPAPGGPYLLLDNQITVLEAGGRPVEQHSLYDLLATVDHLRGLVHDELARRARATVGCADLHRLAGRRGREVSRALRDQPGSPCDVLHANTLEIVPAHPAGLWDDGDVLVAVRELDLIAVVSPRAGAVRWWWGPGELSGPHQPSALPGGSVLVFDNGRAARRSRVLEIDPATGEIVFTYVADPPAALFTELAGGCQQLPSGTLLVTDAQHGRAIEISRDGSTLRELHIRTNHTAGGNSRCDIYRLAAIPARTAARLATPAGRAWQLATTRVRCQPEVRSSQ